MLPKLPLFQGEDTTVDTALMDSSIEEKGDHFAMQARPAKKNARSKSTTATNITAQVQGNAQSNGSIDDEVDAKEMKMRDV